MRPPPEPHCWPRICFGSRVCSPIPETLVQMRRKRNRCSKVWSGTVRTAAFNKFVVETCRTEAAARKFLADRGVEHYWDLATAEGQEG